MESIWFFEKTDLFSLLCPHKFKEYKKQYKLSNYKNKDYIYFEKDSAQKIYLIANGKVKIGYFNEDGEEVIQGVLSKGELFGEKAFLGIDIRNEFAQAIGEKTSICPIGVDKVHDLMRKNKVFSLKIYKFLGMRFKKMERRLQLLLYKDSKTRLLEFLNELKEDYGTYCPTTGSTIAKHPYTQKEIANLIAISRPTLNILMNELKDNQVLDYSRNKIIFP